MIAKIVGTKNGYILDDSSTNEEFQSVCRSRPIVKCIIVNYNTRKRFSNGGIFRRNIMTINNKIHDNEFYFNSVN